MWESKIKISRSITIKDEDIRFIENKYQVNYPMPYRHFMLKYNGGKLTPSSFNFENSDEGSDMQYLFSINVEEEYKNLLDVCSTYVDTKRLPANLMPIGRDSGGNLICISTRNDNSYGCIYFWDHELENIEYNITSISSDFESFLNKLYTIDLEDL